MKPDDAIAAVLDALDAATIPSMIVGGFSSNFYGIPRATGDADIVIHVVSTDALRDAINALPKELEWDPQISFETITGNVRHIVRIAGTPFVIELFELADDPFQQMCFSRRRNVYLPMIHRNAWLPTAEDVIVQKLRWGRPKDIGDVRDVLAIQQETLDIAYIEEWCAKHGSLDTFQNLASELRAGDDAETHVEDGTDAT